MIEQHVTSLELSKRLKELGVPQNTQATYFWWNKAFARTDRQRWEVNHHSPDRESREDGDAYSAFLASELGEMLPAVLDNQILRFAKGITEKLPWHAYYELFSGQKSTVLIEDQGGDTEANARAKLLIYLIKQGVVDVKKLSK